MMIPRLKSLTLALTFILVTLAGKTHAQEYDLDTSTTLYWPMPDFQKPSYRAPQNDPTFGTKITRIVGDVGTSIQNVSGQSWRNVARHGYSVRQPWNADESVLYLGRHRTFNGSWGPSLFVDGLTYEPISTADEPSGNEHRWHPTNPNLRLILRDNSVITWNYQTGQTNTIMSFAGYSNTSMGYTGNWSDDGNKIAMFATRNSDGKTVVFALDTQTGTKYPDIDASSVDIDYVSISPLGNYILVNGNFGQGSDRTKIYDLNGNQVGPYWSEYGRPSHFDMAVDQNGDEVAVGVDKAVDEGRVIKRRLSDGQVTVLTPGGWAIHTSARALGRPGWAFASTSSSTNYQPYLSEIIAIKLDGSRIERICHARNAFSDYQNEAHPCPSPSGSRVIFATDWGANGLPIQAYVADFKNMEIAAGFSVDAGLDQAICEGGEATLTASGASSYVWSNGETSETITVSPSETTTYTVTGTDSNGNEDTDTVTVTVNPMPNANAGGDVEICQEDSITLSASGGDSYLWSTGQQSQSITVNPDATTTYTVTVTLNGCSSSDDVVVTVNPRPAINAGNDVDIYLGESTTLTATGDGDFLWSTGETTDSITVSPSVSTTYTVTTSLNGCSNSDSVDVNVIQTNVAANAGEDVTICEGVATTLTASGGENYLWSTGETTQSITVNPMETTTYTVTVSDQYTSDTDDVVVNVNPTPNANAGTDQTIDLGQSITLTATGGNSYLWSTGETSQSIVVSPSYTKTYTVEAFINDCSDIDDVTVTVVGTVNANAGQDVEICQGSEAILTATGGDSYQWNTGATTQSITVSPNQTSNYSVTVTNQYGSDTDDVTVTVNPIPVANAGEDQTIESGQNIILTASGGNSYLWSTGETSQSISVSPDQTTTYTVEAFVNGCSDIDDVLVNVVAPVNASVVDDVESCPGETVTLTAEGGLYYNWSTGESTSAIQVSPEASTLYTVEVSNGINSQVLDVMVSVDNCQATINNPETNEFEYVVYPNPSKGDVNIKVSGLQHASNLMITDVMGKTIKIDKIDTNNGQDIYRHYNLSYLSNGLYFVRLKQPGKRSLVKKLIMN